jgi:hypothetical protein
VRKPGQENCDKQRTAVPGVPDPNLLHKALASATVLNGFLLQGLHLVAVLPGRDAIDSHGSDRIIDVSR